MGERTVFVDGYNAIHATPSLAALFYSDLGAARDALLKQVVASYRHASCRLVIVFDGDNASETCQPIPGCAFGQVIYSRRDETADSVIVRMAGVVRGVGGDALVVSNDAEVRAGAESHGAATARVSPRPAAPRLLQQRHTHRVKAREVIERESDDAEARAAARKKGNPRKPPRRRDR